MSACATCLDTGYIETEDCTCGARYCCDGPCEPMCGMEPCPKGCGDAASIQYQHREEASA